MPEEISGLIVDLSCVLCRCLPTGDMPFFEMQNRFFICGACLLHQEHQRKSIKGRDGLPIKLSDSMRVVLEKPTQSDGPQTARQDDTIFGVLGISVRATEDEVIDAIDDKIRFWMRQGPSKQSLRMREQLEEWREEVINNPQFLSSQRVQQDIIALPTLIVGGQEATTLKDFVELCERSEAGWLDGERYLQERDLEHWVLALTKDNGLDRKIAAARTISSSFLALNEVLYLLLPARPFRLYEQDQWQALETVKSASTVKELAPLCDTYWSTAVHHLYDGSLLIWLEYSQGCQELRVWYSGAIQDYGGRGYLYRSLGLELLLERVVPKLRKPELIVTFDGINDKYTLSRWDSEIAHRPIAVTIGNKTRGVVLLSLAVEASNSNGPTVAVLPFRQGQTSTAFLQQNAPGLLYIRPGEQDTFTVNLSLDNLERLNYGRAYHCALHIAQHTTASATPIIHKRSVTIDTMAYRQGFRRYLWGWGLHGGFPGLLLNFIAEVALALLILLSLNIFNRIPFIDNNPFLNNVILALTTGTRSIATVSLGTLKFVLITGALAGLSGSLVGWKKGHATYSMVRNRHDFVLAGRLLALLFFFGLCYWTWNVSFANSPVLLVDAGWQRFAQVGGSLLISLLLLVSISILGLIRSFVEWSLRRRYRGLLTPKGS